MNFYQYIRDVVGYENRVKAYSIPYFYLDYVNSYEDAKQYVHEFKVKSAHTNKYYDVKVMNNGNEFYNATCSCEQYKNTKSCKHIAACLDHYHYEMEACFIIDPYKESKEILNLFYEPIKEYNIKEKLNIMVDLVFYQNTITFRLFVGSAKKYVLNTKTKFDNFLYAYHNGGDFVLGSKLTYNKLNYYFDEADTKIIDYLASFERNYYVNNVFSVAQRDVDFLLENLDISKLNINGKFVKNIVYDLPTDFKLQLNKDNNYELFVRDLENYEVLSKDCKYIYYLSNLYVISKDYQKLIYELINRSIKSVCFEKNDLDKFSHGLLKKVKDKLEISEDVCDIQIAMKPNVKIYLDIQKETLTCKPVFEYKGIEIGYLEENSQILRDYAYEEEIVQDVVNSGFKLDNKKLLMETIEEIGYFLENDLNNLSQKYEVFTSKKLNGVSLIKKSQVTKDFSIGASGIMSFEFGVDNIDFSELKDIFNALDNKKTYHRLKNGNIINLESDQEIQELGALVNDLELDYNHLTQTIEVPKYRALYIDSLKTNKYHDIKTNNTFDDFIKNFKEYQNVKIKFDENDEAILRDYQKIGVRWLYTLYKCDFGGILADEMGLGKSIQAICFIKEVLKEKKDARILIVCPTSLVYNWKKEFDKFAPSLKYTIISDNKEQRMATLNEYYNIYIMSYGILRNDLELHKSREYEVCIIDEAQYIKNYQAGITVSLKSVCARHKLALTGTPLENSVTELWSIFDFLMPGYLNSVKKFREKYHISDVKEEDLKRLEKLNYQIKPFILRRKKKDVYKDLPDKIENNIYLELPDEQKKLYLSVLKETQKEIDELVAKEGFKKARFKILQLLTKLRQICIEPNVLYNNYAGESIKLEKLVEMIKDYVKDGHKILVFSSFKRILDNVKKRLLLEKLSFYSIDGSVSGKDRLKLVDAFNEDQTSCFLITLKSGGTGLNLTSADIVIHLDIWWNPQVENQATDRAHRIGQTKKVTVNKLITKGTIEERIVELQEKKKILSDNLIEGHSDEEMLATLDEKDIKELLSFNNEE